MLQGLNDEILLARMPFRDHGRQLGTETPLELLFLSRALKDAGIKSRILDLQIEPSPFDALQKSLELIRPRMAGLSFYSVNSHIAEKAAKQIKEFDPRILTAVGGIHASALPEEILRNCPWIDAAVFGEGERTVAELAKAALGNHDLRNINGVVYRDGDNPARNPKREFIKNLDDLPFVSFEGIQLGSYIPLIGNFKSLPSVNMMTTRGCPFQCTYCSTHELWGGTVRAMSTPRILDEIESRVRSGIHDIRFNDDTFTLYRDRITELCEGLLNRRLPITWNCYSRIDTIDGELIDLMARAGCYLIKFGIEAGSQRTLDTIKKGLSPEKTVETIRMVRKAGIVPKGSFILGVEGETEEDRLQTLRFARRINLPAVTFNVYSLLPGSEDYHRKEREGALPPLATWDTAKKINAGNSERFLSYKRRAYIKAYLNLRWWTLNFPFLMKHFCNRPWKILLAVRLLLWKLFEPTWS